MTKREFMDEMQKLISRFDKKYYPIEVLELIFCVVEDLSVEWLKKTVSYFMGHHRPPLLPEFKEHARIEIDRLKIGSVSRFNDRNFPESIFSDSQRALLFEISRKLEMRSVKLQDDFVLHFTSQLKKVTDTKDRKLAHELFQEAAKWCELPYALEELK